MNPLTRSFMKFKSVLAVLLLGLALLGGCAASSTPTASPGQEQAQENKGKAAPAATPEPSPRPYSKDLEELRAAFNRDKGKVRLVTLLSPT